MKLLGGLSVAMAVLALAVPMAGAAEFEKYGIESVGASLTSAQAGAHPEFDTSFKMKIDSTGFPFAQTRDVEVNLPPGLLANLAAFPQCTVAQFLSEGCPIDSQLGVVDISAYELGAFTEPLYYLPAGPGSVARLGFYAQLYPNVVNVRVRSESDYGASVSAEGVLSTFPPVQVRTTIWAVPADKSHDALRITPREASEGKTAPNGGRPSNLLPMPLTVNPTRCDVPLAVGFTATSYQIPSQPSTMSAPLGSIFGCGKLAFFPRLAATPTTREAAAPSGLDVTVALPQDETVKGLATSHIRDVELGLPAGVTIAAGAADGQEACSDAEAGYKSRRAASCPAASKLGDAEIDVPALKRPLQGALYLRTPAAGDLFRVWLIADDLGAHIALPGELRVNKATGQISSAFVEMPQAPVREAKVHVFGGPRGPLATPSSCGVHQSRWKFTPWSGTDPVEGSSPMTIAQGCDTGGFSPRLSAGSTNPVAGAFSRLVTTLSRESDEQNISSLSIALPPGLSAKLAGISPCEGAAASSGNCPSASKIGSALVATGPGPAPLWVPQPGRAPIEVYLAGPYKGAPFSIVVRAPAQAGPFDLGTVVIRAAVRVDPETAQATISVDPLPQILEGVPLTYRTIQVDVDRHNFTLNPTNCKQMAVTSELVSSQGATAASSSRFQVGDCRDLSFKPRLSLLLEGKSNRGAHPKLRAVLRTRPGDANLASAQVALPHAVFLDQAHIGTVCTRVQFAAEKCPDGSIYGHARAFTPLLDRPLEGSVYLRSSRHPLPDLVIALKGQIDVNAVGRIDSIDGGIRTTFEKVPDAPVAKVVLSMEGGKKGLLVISRDICVHSARATVRLGGQNGKRQDLQPPLRTACAKR